MESVGGARVQPAFHEMNTKTKMTGREWNEVKLEVAKNIKKYSK